MRIIEITFKKKYTRYLVNLLMAIACSISAISNAAEQQENRFYFIQITDTHFGDGDHLKRTQKIVKQINNSSIKVECVVHTGDITMNKSEDQAVVDSGLSIMGKLTVPTHYVSGNHDILARKLKSTREAYVENFGGLISKAEYNGVMFIFVYTEPLRKLFALEGYQPLIQLEEYLKKLNGKPVIVFHHAPSVEDFYKNKLHQGWSRNIKDEWVKVLNAYNVKAVIAGHFHRDEHHWLGDVPLYVSAPVAGYGGRQATFRIYEYYNGKIGYRTQYIE